MPRAIPCRADPVPWQHRHTRHAVLAAERHNARDLGGSYASLGKGLGARAEPATDPGDIAGAIPRAQRVTENGKTALLEFITSAETAFSHLNGAAA